MSRNQIKLGSARLEVVRSTPLIGVQGIDFYREEIEAEQGNCVAVVSVVTQYVGKRSWLAVLGCPWVLIS